MHWADKPESYLAQPKDVQDFISNMPTAWDETRLLSGYPGECVVMARRKGSTWYVAGINGKDESQKLSLDLSSLTKKNSQVVLFEDSGSAKNPWKISYRKVRGMKGYINAQPRGGFVMVIK
mgnify:FL=1